MRLHFSGTAPAAGAFAAVLALAAAACGSFSTSTAVPTGGAGPVSQPPNRSASTLPAVPASGAAARVGADCAMIPATGKGSIASMSSQQAVRAASSNPQLSVFAAAVRKAGLDKTLNTRHGYTLVIPADSAFASLNKTQIVHLHNTGNLAKIVRYNAVISRVSPAQFGSAAHPVTLQGKKLTLSRSGSVYKVNDATVLCGNIKTRNATVYIVSKVLLPPG